MSSTQSSTPTIMLRLYQVQERVLRSKSAIYADMADGKFPKAVKLGRSSAWIESEIEAWLQERIRRAGDNYDPRQRHR